MWQTCHFRKKKGRNKGGWKQLNDFADCMMTLQKKAFFWALKDLFQLCCCLASTDNEDAAILRVQHTLVKENVVVRPETSHVHRPLVVGVALIDARVPLGGGIDLHLGFDSSLAMVPLTYLRKRKAKGKWYSNNWYHRHILLFCSLSSLVSLHEYLKQFQILELFQSIFCNYFSFLPELLLKFKKVSFHSFTAGA